MLANMSVRCLVGITAMVGLTLVSAAAGQPGLKAGTVTATIDGAPFSASVSIATMAEGNLVLTSLSNQVQIQVPKAKLGTFQIKLEDDGGLIDVIVGLKVGRRMISPISGSITIKALSSSGASGEFAFKGKDVGTDSPVDVINGQFNVKFTGKP